MPTAVPPNPYKHHRFPAEIIRVLSQSSILRGKIRKLSISNSMAYRLQNSRKSNFATTPLSWATGRRDRPGIAEV